MVNEALHPSHLVSLSSELQRSYWINWETIKTDSCLWEKANDVVGSAVWSKVVSMVFSTSFTSMKMELKLTGVGFTVVWNVVETILSEHQSTLINVG